MPLKYPAWCLSGLKGSVEALNLSMVYKILKWRLFPVSYKIKYFHTQKYTPKTQTFTYLFMCSSVFLKSFLFSMLAMFQFFYKAWYLCYKCNQYLSAETGKRLSGQFRKGKKRNYIQRLKIHLLWLWGEFHIQILLLWLKQNDCSNKTNFALTNCVPSTSVQLEELHNEHWDPHV